MDSHNLVSKKKYLSTILAYFMDIKKSLLHLDGKENAYSKGYLEEG